MVYHNNYIDFAGMDVLQFVRSPVTEDCYNACNKFISEFIDLPSNQVLYWNCWPYNEAPNDTPLDYFFELAKKWYLTKDPNLRETCNGTCMQSLNK